MTIKRKIALILVLLMITAPSIAGATPKAQFADLPKTNVHYDAIMSLTDQEVIKGYEDGSFKPYQNISRQHVAVILTHSLEIPIPSKAETKEILTKYNDVNSTHEYAKQIAAVTKANIFKGSNGYFNPSSDITREQMATVLTNGFNLTKYKQDKVHVNLKNVDPSHKDAVQALANLDITIALKDFKPSDKLKRAQFASFLVRTQDVTLNGEWENEESKSDVFKIKNHKMYIYGITLGDGIESVIDKLGKPNVEREDYPENLYDKVLEYDDLNIYMTENKVALIIDLNTTRQFFYKEFVDKYPDKKYINQDGKTEYLFDKQGDHLVFAKYENNAFRIYFGYADGNFHFYLNEGLIYPANEGTSSEDEQSQKDESEEIKIINNAADLKKALQANDSDSPKVIKLGKDIELQNTIHINNVGVTINGNGKTVTSSPPDKDKAFGEDAFEVKADNVHFKNITVKPQNSIAFVVTAREGFKITDSVIKSKQDLSKGIMIEDNFAMDVRETAAVINTIIDGPGIGIFIEGGLLTLQDSTIKNTFTALKITEMEVPKLEGNLFTNNFEDINTVFVSGIENDLYKNTFDTGGPKINVSER